MVSSLYVSGGHFTPALVTDNEAGKNVVVFLGAFNIHIGIKDPLHLIVHLICDIRGQ